MSGFTRGRLIGGVALVAALGLALGLTFADDEVAADDAAPSIAVGTFQPQVVFEQYYRTQELFEYVSELQAEAQAAQQAGDQQKLMELQMRFQEREQQLMEVFTAEMDVAVPEVAKAANIDLVAMEIQYAAPHLDEPTDLTEQILARINADAPKDEAEAEDIEAGETPQIETDGSEGS